MRGGQTSCRKCDPVSGKKEYEVCSQVSNVSLVIVQSLLTNGDGVQAK